MDRKSKTDLMVLIQDSNLSKSSELCPQATKISSAKDDLSNKGKYSNPPSPEISSFCTMSNLQSAVVYLSQELQNLGFRYKIIEPNEEKLNLVALVNACWDTVQLYHSAIKDGNRLYDSRRRDVADMNHLQGSVRDLKIVIEEKDRILLESQEKERQLTAINKALASKVKSEKDEVKRLNNILQQREQQHQHESRKKELELNKLQDRLHRQVSGDRAFESRMSSMTMTGSLHRSDRARAKWRTDTSNIKHEEEFYRRAQSHLELWIEQLSQEVDLLKEFLSAFVGKLSKLAVKCTQSETDCIAQEVDNLNESLACSVLSSDSGEMDPLFSLSFISIRDKVRKTLDENLLIVSQFIDKKENTNTRSKDDDQDLNGNDANSSTDMDRSILRNLEMISEGLCVEKEEEIRTQSKQLMVLRKKLQREREVFAEAAVRLNKERAIFEAEKVELLRNQFLEELPSTIMSTSGDPFTPNTSLESPLNQSLSDLYGDSPQSMTAIPNITSPTGNITHTVHPVTLGPTRLPRNHRESLYGTTRSRGGKSDPSTRNSSLSRSADMRYLHESSRAKTLERPSRSTCPAPLNMDSNDVHGSSSSSNSCFSRTVKKDEGLMTLPNHFNFCPSVEKIGNRRSNGEESPVRDTVMHPTRVSDAHTVGSSTKESISRDSGFCHDAEDFDNPGMGLHVKDAQTNYRLNVLESSLMNLLNQISSKDRMTSTCPTIIHSNPFEDSSDNAFSDGGSETVARTGSSSSNRASSSYDVLCDRGDAGSEVHVPRCRLSVSGPVRTKEAFDPSLSLDAKRLSTRQESAPGSLSSSRKSSEDRRSGRAGDYYLKKIQNNFSKWYCK